MRVIVFGAGGIGGTIGARLHLAGTEVILIARGAHLNALARDGMDFVAPDGRRRLRIPAVAGPEDIAWRDGDLVLLAMKSQHTAAALDALAACAGRDVPVACAQNGVANERMALRRFQNVYGMLVNLPAVHLRPGEVVTHAQGFGGILDTGCYPQGSDEIVEELTTRLTDAGFSAYPDERIMRKKYAKLLMNLVNLVQAACTDANGELPDEDGERTAFTEITRRLRREALACFDAAGIDCTSRDESRARNENTYQMVDIDGFPWRGGSSWQSFSRATGNVETDFLNGEITLLGGLHQVPTPCNRVCQAVATMMIRQQLPVGSLRPTALLKMMEQAGDDPGGR